MKQQKDTLKYLDEWIISLGEYNMIKNFWLGCNELVIIFHNGTHHVIEEFENWKTVFTGCLEDCIKYCNGREIEYEESIVG